MFIEIDYHAVPVGNGKFNVIRTTAAKTAVLSYAGAPVTFHCVNIASLAADMFSDGSEADVMLHGEYFE